MSQMCSDASHRDHGRSLQYVLHGDIVRVSNWTCSDNCKPPHPDEITLIEKYNNCTESKQIGNLQLQDDIDLQCTGMNVTCADLQNDTLKNFHQELYSNCNQDEELLTAHCELTCRLNMYPTKRCIYTFDRNNKYGMHGDSGMYGFHHCVLHRDCQDETEDSLENNALYCNITDTHELLFSTTGAATSNDAGTTTTTTLADGSGPVAVVSMQLRVAGLDFDKVNANVAAKAQVKNDLMVSVLASLPNGYTKEHIAITLSRGSVKAQVEITPLSTSTASDLKTWVSAERTTMETTALLAVKALPGVAELMEPGLRASDLAVTSTEPVESTAVDRMQGVSGPIERVTEAPSSDDGAGMIVLGVAIGGGGVALMAAVAVAIYFRVCRKQHKFNHAPSSNSIGGTVHEESEGSTVVVGRPVPEGQGDSANPSGGKGADGKEADKV